MSEDRRKSLGVTLARLERSYKVRAEAPDGDMHLIITSSRARAIKYLGLFAVSENYRGASIELGNQSFDQQNLEQMP